jgi:hypothetical protein
VIPQYRHALLNSFCNFLREIDFFNTGTPANNRKPSGLTAKINADGWVIVNQNDWNAARRSGDHDQFMDLRRNKKQGITWGVAGWIVGWGSD